MEIFGVFPETVVNRCTQRGIALRRLRAVDGQTIRASVDERELDRLREIALRCQCELRLLSLRGGSRDRALLRRRFWLPLTALLTAALLLLSSLFVWEIELRGCEKLSRGRVLRALAECGLSRGSFWPGLSADLLRSELLTALPELAWMTVNLNGSRAIVLLAEREEKPEIYAESAPCDLIASRAGIVRRVSALNGRALVGPGDAVREGETLIASEMDSITASARHVRARGEVWCDTWYELTAICPAPTAGKGEKRRQFDRFALKIGSMRVNFYGKTGKTLDGYDKIVHEYKLGIKGLFAMPLSLVRESMILRDGADRAPDLQGTEQRLLRYLEDQIEGEVRQSSFSSWEKDGVLCVTLRARCLENIARIHEITQAEEAPP